MYDAAGAGARPVGPHVETKEFQGDFAAVDEAAKMWAGKIAEACGGPMRFAASSRNSEGMTPSSRLVVRREAGSSTPLDTDGYCQGLSLMELPQPSAESGRAAFTRERPRAGRRESTPLTSHP
jgi:hypothetical protein